MRARLVAMTVALGAATTLSGPAAARVVDSAPGGFTVENSVVVPVARAEAWRGLFRIGAWWPADHTWWGDAAKLSLDARAGGCFCERDGAREAWHMAVSFVDPETTLRMTGGLGPLQGMGLHGALEFRFEDAGPDRTKITLWYRAGGYTPDDMAKFAPVVDRVQAQQLGGLATHLGGAIAVPDPAPADAPADAPARASDAPPARD